MFGLKLALPRWARRNTAFEAAPEAVPEAPDPPKASASGRLSPIASAVVLGAGAGVAFWWWTQWARGRAESELAEADVSPVDGEPPAVAD